MYVKIKESLIINTDGIRCISKADDNALKITYADGTNVTYFLANENEQDEVFEDIWRVLGEDRQTE